jgi:hypothetical protein
MASHSKNGLWRDKLVSRPFVSVTPENSTNLRLSYARILLSTSVPPVSFASGDREIGFICLGVKLWGPWAPVDSIRRI